ncbi:metallophosphoesterase [Marinibacterium sp. SX1]|uniref:metallophosphoesterase n=1 Tax=Marinibacterium sp. SX1 TaxID=3388424 RepID=UPI003D16D490
MTRIVQLTDSHITARGTLWKDQVDNAARLRLQVSAVNALAPDLVVHSGDLVEMGPFAEGPAEYDHAAEILADLSAPLRLLPGNHDGRAAMRAAFPEQEWQGAPYLNFSADLDGLHLVGLDSVVERQTEGDFPPAQAAWLGGALDDRPTLIVLHHPPCPMGLPFMDGFRFDNGPALACTIAGHNVLRLACGHVHADVAVHWAGTVVAAADAGSVHIPPDMPAFDALPPEEDRRAGIEPLRLRVFDWQDGQLSVKTLAAEPPAAFAVI